MICSIFNQTRVRDEFVDAVQLRTDGNPLFIEETLKSLVSDGDIFTERGEWTRKPLSELRIPLSVQDAVQRQAALLSEDARQVVETAAAIGQRFQFNTLSAVTGRGNEDLLLLVRELLRVQLIVEHSAHEFEFRHALTREAVYANLLKRERLALHAAIGSILRANAAAPSALAHHFYEAESWAEALQFARVAAEQAQ